MESDSSDDEQYNTADDSESDDQGHQSFHNELSSSSESSDEVSGQVSIRGIFKFGKLSSSKVSGKENVEFQVEEDKEEMASEGDEDVNQQTSELTLDPIGETGLHSSVTDNSAKDSFPGRDSPDSTEDLKEQEVNSIDIRDDSDMKADEKVDTAETMEATETLMDNINSCHMSPSISRGLEGIDNAKNTDKTYQIDDFQSISESFVILDTESTSTLLIDANDQMGEIEKNFQEPTQNPPSEGLEQSFEICDESYGESGPIYENIENIKVTPIISKDTIMTSLSIPGNSAKEDFMHLSQPKAVEFHKESVKKLPPPVAPKPLIVKQKQGLNESQIQSIMKDEASNKTDEEQCLKEAEQKLMIRQSLEINESTHKSSQLEMDMIDIVKQEKTESAVEGNSLPMESFSIIVCEEKTNSVCDADETANTEQRPLSDIKIDDIEQLSQYEKQTGFSVQQPLIETNVYEIEQTPQEHANVDGADQKSLKDTQVDKTQGRLLKNTKIETAEESPPDSKDDADQKSQTDIQVGYSENEEPIKKMPDLVKIFESIVQDQNEPMTDLRVAKRRGNIILKPHKQSSAEPRPLNQSNAEESQMKQSNVPKTKKDDFNESRSPKEMDIILPPLPQKNQVITESVKPENPENDSPEDSAPPIPPPKGSTVMESLKHIVLEREMLKNPELTCPPTPPPKSLSLVKTHNPDVTSHPSVVQSTPPLLPKRTNQSTSKSTQNMHSGLLHDQQEPDLQVQTDRPYLQTSNLQEDMSGAQSSTRYLIPPRLQGDVQNPATSGGQQNLTYDMNGQPVLNAGTSWQQLRHPLHPGQPPWGPHPWGHPHMPLGLHGHHEQYWNPWSFNPSYGHQFPPGMQHNFPGMNDGRFFNRPPYVSSQEPPIGQAYKTTEDQNQHLQQQQMQQQQQQHQMKQQLQQHQPRLLVPEGEISGYDKHPVPNRKQDEQQNEEKKEIEKAKNEPVNTTPKHKKTSKTSGLPKVSTDRKKNDTSKEDKERKAVPYPKRSGQDVVKSSPQPAMRNEEQKQEKGAKSEEIASKPSYFMVIGLSESTSDENLLNFMEGKSGANVKEIVYGPRRENAVVIFEGKPDQENLQSKVSRKTLDGKVIKVFSMPPPTSIIVSTNDPKEFSKDTLIFHFEAKKYGFAELVEDGIKITEDGCFIMTFTDSDAIERVCAMQHKVENIPLNVSPYYQFKEWMAWNTAIHGINIPKPFAHKVDPVIAKYLVSFSRGMKAVQVAMMEIHAGIELQTDAVLLSCLLNLEVKDCRKLVISWRKDAEENWNKCLSSRFLIEKISNLSNIWEDLIAFVKSLIEGKDIMLVEERFEDYIQVIGFCDEVKTTHVEIMKKKEKLERIGRVAKETMPLKSAAKKRLLDRDGIFQRLRVQFSDFDVHFEQSSEEIVLSGVIEDRNNAKLLIFEELRKFDDPFEISDSTDHFNQFIKEGAPKNYIIKEMETNGLIVDWDVSTEKRHVFVYCIPAHNAEHAATQMKKMVKEINIPLSQAAQLFVTTEDWKMYQAETESRCDGLVHIVVKNDLTNIIWISMDGLYADILQELKDFIKKNTVTEEMIQCNPVIKKYMQTYWEPKDYKEIEEKSGDKNLQLSLHGEKLMVKGTAEGILKAKELWREKTSEIVSKSHTVKRVGIKEVLESEEQSGMLKALEMEHRCLILTETSNLSLQMKINRDTDDENYDTISYESMIKETPRSVPFKCQNGLTIYLTKGQLAKQKVDVIVCATSPDLNLNSGAASKSLLQEGGQGLQIDCKMKYDENIEEGEVVDINGGNLQCDKVYLTVLPDWRRSNNGQSLMNVMLQCLTKADGASKKSIAFAAMGTGKLHYPHEDVASLMYNACVSFDIEYPKSTLKEVRFVLFDKDHVSIKAFEKEEKNMLCGGAIPRSTTSPPKEHLFGSIKVLQVIDELAKQKVDAILCSCATNLVLSQSGACAALVKNGGQKLQDECKQKYPNGIQLGEIATIGGGNLQCKHVFLTALPPYAENGESVLSGVMTSTLKLAAVHGCKSIAMPAMGTGFLKYPVTTVAKTMYDAVRDYAKVNPNTSLTTIKFVLYFKDKPTQSAFKDYMKQNLSRSSTRRNRKIAGHDVRKLKDDKPCIKINPGDSGNLSSSVGKVKVQVYKGDILDEKTDAIVNSVGGDFSFQGGVANSLKKKCSDLEERCKDKKYLDKLRKDGVVVMNITGLPCKAIMHVKFQEQLPGWKKIFGKCFKKAIKHKLVSLSFPVLGTGGGSTVFDPKKIAETFFEALVQFDEENAGHQLQNINIVVFHKQPQFIPEIEKAMKKISLQGPRGTFGKMMDKIKDHGQSIIESICPRSGVLPPQPKPAAFRSQMSIATIQVYSDMEKNIELCIFNLDKKLDKAYMSTCLTDELIAKMSVKELEDFFQTDLFVECEFIPEEKQVLIKGTQKHVFEAQTLFHRKMLDKTRQDNEKRDAEQLYQVVQWQFEEVTEDGVTLVPYDVLTNYRMEEAFKKGDVNLELKDPTKKKVYVVDFKEYAEFDKEDDEDKVKIVRKDIMKDKAKSVPDFWMEMKPDENLRLVNIPNQDPEYSNLETTFLTECKTGTYANRIPNLATMKVEKIQRIQNRTLYQQYAAKKQLMMQQYKDKPNVKVEWKAWHGTAAKNVESIYNHGFNRSYCGTHGVWFGQGVYFATNASYSARSWLAAGNQAPPPGTKQFIFYVSVCVGEYIKGDPKMRYLPAKDPTKPTDVYDSAVNDVNKVEEIVIFNDTQAYPDYLITFTT